jgi:signal transduction histidine kinase
MTHGVRPLFSGLVLGAVLLPAFLYAVVAWQDRISVLSQAEQNIKITTGILEANAHDVFTTHRLVASLVNEHIQGMTWSEISDSAALHEYLAEVVHDYPQILSIWLIDSSGLIRNSSAVFPAPSVRVTDRDYFTALREHDTGFFMGRSVHGRVFRDQDVFNVAQRRLSPSGSFDGVVDVSALLSYFTNFSERTVGGPGATAVLVRSDGIILARKPAVDTNAPPLDAKSPLMQAIAKGDSGYFQFHSTIDDTERLYAYQKVADFPTYVGYGISLDSVLKPWHKHLFVNGGFFALGALALTSLAFIVEQRAREIGLLNATLSERTSALEVANRELEGFSYSTSHVLRAPLRAIDGFSQILLDEYATALDGEGRRLIGVLRLSARELNEQISGILEFLRLNRDKMSRSTIDMAEAVQTTLKELAPKIRGRELRIEISPLPKVCGDAAMIERVLLNLLDNAVKFTAPRADARIEVGAFSEDGDTVYYVRDNGVGFDKRFADKLFGVFSRLHGADYSGNGTGLAIVRRVISRHGGRVWAEGELDKGATVYFALPALREGPATTAAVPRDDPALTPTALASARDK